MTFDITKLAYCGIYCEQCAAKVAFEEQNLKHIEAMPFKITKIAVDEQDNLSVFDCECCKGRCICGPCRIKDCATQKAVQSCAECHEFPCEHIDRFANDGIPHHHIAIENLRTIRENGLEKWFEDLKPFLRCHCGERQSWYYFCPAHQGMKE